MRWPWRRHGRRPRSDPPQRKVDPWAASWGDTFLPQPPIRSAVAESPSSQSQSQSPTPTSTVRLGFSDGTELELAEGDEHFHHLVEVAGRLNTSEAGGLSG